MKTTIYILTLTLFISACGQTNLKSDNQEYKQANATADTIKANQATEKQTKLDSIENANNESIVASGDNITKAFVFVKDGDSTISLTANIRQDHRIFGYAMPDIKSERLLELYGIDFEKIGKDLQEVDDLAKDLITYFENNSDRMDYARYREKGFQIGSGL